MEEKEFICSFHMFIECLLCASHFSRTWNISTNKINKYLCGLVQLSLRGEIRRQVITITSKLTQIGQ